MKKRIVLLLVCLLIVFTACNNVEMPKEEPDESINTEVESTDIQSGIYEEQIDVLYDYEYDLTRDGEKDVIRVMIDSDATSNFDIGLFVFSNNSSIFQTELDVHVSLGTQFYLVIYEGKHYLMQYDYSVHMDRAECWYEVFSLSSSGEKVVLDENKVEISLFEVEKLDKHRWIEFAESVNRYFDSAFLLISTEEGEVIYSEPHNKVEYQENFEWLLAGEKDEAYTIEDTLNQFINDTKKVYK